MVYVEDCGKVELKGAYLEMEKFYKDETSEEQTRTSRTLVIPQENGIDIRIDLDGLLEQDEADITGDSLELDRLEKLFV